MKTVSIHEIKTHFSQILAKLREDERVIICKRGVPLAEIHLLPQKLSNPRPLNLGKGTAKISPDFFEPMTEAELAEFYQPPIIPK